MNLCTRFAIPALLAASLALSGCSEIFGLAASVIPALVQQGQKSGQPLSLDVYKLRLSEMFRAMGKKMQEANLSGHLALALDESATGDVPQFRDVKFAKIAFYKLIRIFEESQADFASFGPPAGLEKKHERIKMWLETVKAQFAEVPSLPDESTVFSQKLLTQFQKINLLSQEALETLRELESGLNGPLVLAFPFREPILLSHTAVKAGLILAPTAPSLSVPASPPGTAVDLTFGAPANPSPIPAATATPAL